MCQHEDFGAAAEWHFSATSHGKRACDGVGGTVNRFAARASLSKVYSSSSISKVERVTIEEGDLVLEEMDFLSCAYNDDWWLVCVLQVDEDREEISVSFLHPHSPSRCSNCS